MAHVGKKVTFGLIRPFLGRQLGGCGQSPSLEYVVGELLQLDLLNALGVEDDDFVAFAAFELHALIFRAVTEDKLGDSFR